MAFCSAAGVSGRGCVSQQLRTGTEDAGLQVDVGFLLKHRVISGSQDHLGPSSFPRLMALTATWDTLVVQLHSICLGDFLTKYVKPNSLVPSWNPFGRI